MKRAVILFLGILLFISGCDRYDHETYSNAELEAGFMQFCESLQTASADNLDGVMNWYSDEYLHNGRDKTGIENMYLACFTEYDDSLSLSGKIVEYWKSYRIVWELRGNYPDSSFVLTEEEDFLLESENKYVFYGNQVEQWEFNADMPVVLIQYFTSTTCGSCPLVAEKLEEMHNILGEQLVVLEYISDADPGGNFFPEILYYTPDPSPPFSAIQGEFLIRSAGEAALTAYESRYEQALAEQLLFRFTALELSVAGNTVTGSIYWEELGELNGYNLQLRAVLLEEEPDLHYTSAPSVYFENRVLGGTQQDYDSALSNAELTIECNIELPEKISFVVWLQDMPEDWDISGAQVYNVIKVLWGE